MTVGGDDSRLEIGSVLYVGQEGSGRLTVNTGGEVEVGGQTEIWGALDVSGGKLTTAGLTMHGGSSLDFTAGQITVNGGDFSDQTAGPSLTINGSTASNRPTLRLDGTYPSGLLKNLTVADTGFGSLEIVGGTEFGVYATEEAWHQVVVGAEVDSSGSVLVSGSDSRFETTRIIVGSAGEGTLAIASGGQVSLSPAGIWIADQAGSRGHVTVQGTDSKLEVAADMHVGMAGDGALEIGPGGTVFTGRNASIGSAPTVGTGTGTGEVAVTGPEAKWRVTNWLTVGSTGEGTLDVESGGQVEVGTGVIVGKQSSATGTINVSGTGSFLQTGFLGIGEFGAGELTIGPGGSVNTLGSGIISGNSASVATAGTGAVTVTGRGGQLDRR